MIAEITPNTMPTRIPKAQAMAPSEKETGAPWAIRLFTVRLAYLNEVPKSPWSKFPM